MPSSDARAGRACATLIFEQAQPTKPEQSAEETAVELAIEAVEAKVRRWEETLETGLLSLEECAGRIKELRGQREDLLSRRVELQKKSRAQAKKIAPIPTRLMEDYIRAMQIRLREKKIGYKKEFLREVVKEVRVRGTEIRLTYRLPMTVRTPPSKENPRTGEFFTLYQMVELMGVEPTASRVRF